MFSHSVQSRQLDKTNPDKITNDFRLVVDQLSKIQQLFTVSKCIERYTWCSCRIIFIAKILEISFLKALYYLCCTLTQLISYCSYFSKSNTSARVVQFINTFLSGHTLESKVVHPLFNLVRINIHNCFTSHLFLKLCFSPFRSSKLVDADTNKMKHDIYPE